jgi:hypothetical protein
MPATDAEPLLMIAGHYARLLTRHTPLADITVEISRRSAISDYAPPGLATPAAIIELNYAASWPLAIGWY